MQSARENRILFVCQSNLCCSPLAAAIATHLFGNKYPFIFESAGVFVGSSSRTHDRRIAKVALQAGIVFEPEPLRALTEDLIQNSKMIFYMDEESHGQIRQLVVSTRTPLHMVTEFSLERRNENVPDPIESEISFEEFFAYLYPVIESVETAFTKR